MWLLDWMGERRVSEIFGALIFSTNGDLANRHEGRRGLVMAARCDTRGHFQRGHDQGGLTARHALLPWGRGRVSVHSS